MGSRRAIDLVVVPFTHETKASTWERDPKLREAATRFDLWGRSFAGAAELLEKMDESGIEQALMPAITGGVWEVSCRYVKSLVDAAPCRLHGTAGIDPSQISEGVRKLDWAVCELGFVGAHSFPHWFGLPPHDRAYYPFYDKCVELDIPIQIHVGSSYYPSMRDVATPSTIDAVAVDFPDLRLVAIHTGYPWERELVSVAWKQPNVYLGIEQRYAASWPQELVDFIKGGGRKKVLWGTNYPMLEFELALAGLAALDLDPEVEELFLYANVKRVYRLS